MAYTNCITIELLSLYRWKETGWKCPVSYVSPDVTVHLCIYESADNGQWKVNMTVDSVDVHNDWADSALQDKVVDAVVKRCKHDAKVVQIFGQSLRHAYVHGLKRTNMFYPTDFRVNNHYKYRFIVALEGESLDKLDGVYLIPAYLPAPRDGIENNQLYKMCCFERFQ
jgi:hypothetical protein